MRYNRNKGFTLLEVMISMLILFIGMTAILDFICTYQRINIGNTLKNEAVKVVESRMEQLRNTKFPDLTGGSATSEIIIRNLKVTYTVTWVVEDIGIAPVNSRAVQVSAAWHYGKDYIHRAQTIMSIDA